MSTNPAERGSISDISSVPSVSPQQDSSEGKGTVRLTIDGECFEVPPELKEAVLRACRSAAKPLPEFLTPREAADFLGVSRPFVTKLVKQKKLPCQMVGKHHRIPSSALLEYKESTFQKAADACDEMARMSQEMGLYDLEGTPESK